MIKFVDFEFIEFAIRGSKLAKRSVQGKLIKHKVGGFWNDLELLTEGAISPQSLILKGPRPFFCQKPLKTAISAAFTQENKKSILLRI